MRRRVGAEAWGGFGPALLLLAGLQACQASGSAGPREGGPSPDGSAAVEVAPTWTLTTTADGWSVEVLARPDPPPLNAPFELEVALHPSRGAATIIDWDSVELSVDARMPAHRHGMLRQPEVEVLGAGRFVARGLLLHMTGAWLLTFDVSVNGVTERAEVPLVLGG